MSTLGRTRGRGLDAPPPPPNKIKHQYLTFSVVVHSSFAHILRKFSDGQLLWLRDMTPYG